jgi:tetratricopeptide (TPR) repeat protein
MGAERCLSKGERVDCKFEDGFFYRGTIEEVGDAGRTYHVIFDDGDVAPAAPRQDVLAPLKKGTRIRYELYTGIVSQDNGDGTYGIIFDDGDELDLIQRSLLLVAEESEKQPEDIEDIEHIGPTERNITLKDEEAGIFLPVLEEQHQAEAAAGSEEHFTAIDPAPPGMDNCGMQQPMKQTVTGGYEEEPFEHIVQPVTVSSTFRAKAAFRELKQSTKHDATADCSSASNFFHPISRNPLYAHLEDLVTESEPGGSSAKLGQAPPDYRLFACLYQAATLEQQRLAQIAEGETWETSPEHVFSSPSSGGPPRPSLRRIVLALTHARVRHLVLTKLTYGDETLEVVQSLCDLGMSYSQQGLWHQVSMHMNRASQILVALCSGKKLKSEPSYSYETADRYHDFGLVKGLGPSGCATLMIKLFQILRAAADEGKGIQILRSDLIWRLQQSSLKNVANLLISPDAPEQMTWGEILARLRSTSDAFTDINMMILEGSRKDTAAAVRVVFERAWRDDGSRCKDCASATSLLNALRRLDSLEHKLPQRIKEVLKGKLSHGPAPIAWEEIMALLVLEESPKARNEWLMKLRLKVMHTAGVCQARLGQTEASRNTLEEGLRELKSHLDHGSDADPLPSLDEVSFHAALGDVLAIIHVERAKQTSRRHERAARKWLDGDEGQTQFRLECKRLMDACSDAKKPLARVDAEARSRRTLLRRRIKQCHQETLLRSSMPLPASAEEDLLETAGNHLLRAWEVLDYLQGQHSSTANACLSLGNLEICRGNYSDAAEWLRKALSIFRSNTPIAAGAKVALGRLLLRIHVNENSKGTSEEALLLLESAASFYLSRVETAASTSKGFDKDNWIDSSQLVVDAQSRAFGETAKALYEDIATRCSEDPRRAAAALAKAARAARAVFGYSVDVAKFDRREGRAWEAVGEANMAASAYERARAIFSDFFGESDPKARHMAASVRRMDPGGHMNPSCSSSADACDPLLLLAHKKSRAPLNGSSLIGSP